MTVTNTPRVVRGRSLTGRGFDGAGAPSRSLLLVGLVGGLLLAASPAAGQVRIEWAPVGSIGASDDVASYLVERESAGGWERLAEVRHSVADPRYQPASGTFLLEDRQGDLLRRYRVTAVDPVGNSSAPAEVSPERAPCAWQTVPVACPACRCGDVLQVLDQARAELVRHNLVEADGFDAAVRGLAGIALVPPEMLQAEGRRVRGMFGEDAQGRRLMYLTPDMAAALHELVHVYEHARGRAWTTPEAHPGWERDPRLEEIDLRFQERQLRSQRKTP